QDTTRTVPEGTFVVNGVGEVIFTPANNFSGNVTPITYTVRDSIGQTSNPATVNVVVTPTAANDSANTPVNTPVNIPILGNDVGSLVAGSVQFPTTGQPAGSTVSPDGKTLTVPNEGAYTANPDGTVTFVPVNGYIGVTTPVRYSVSDGVTTRTANITVNVAASLGSLRGVVFQDLDGNGSQGAGEPGIANVDLILTNGSFTRTVTTDANGVYTADNVPTGSVTVDVNTNDPDFPAVLKNAAGVPNQTAGVDPSVVAVATSNTSASPANAGADGYRPNPPIAVNDSTTTTADTNVNIPVLNNDSSSAPSSNNPASVVFTPTGQPAGSTVSPDGKTLTVPNEGTYTINPTTGVVTFDPLPTFNGSTTPVQYTFEDSNGQPSNPAQIAVDVGAPSKGNISGTVFEDTNGNGVLDAGEPRLENVQVTITPATGAPVTVVTNAQGVYTALNLPTGNAVVDVVDSSIPAIYKNAAGVPNQTAGNDPTNSSNVAAGASVTIAAGTTVNPGIDGYRLNPPLAVNDSSTTPVNTPVTFTLTGNDTATNPANVAPDTVDLDPATPGQQTTRTIAGQGTYTVNGVGEVTFTPANNFSGNVTPITYTVRDSIGQTSNPATINTLVTPTAANDNASTPVNTPVQIPVLGNDVGSLDPTQVFFPAQPNGTPSNGGRTLTTPEGVFTVSPTTGVVTFTPNNGFTGSVPTVRYTSTDGVTTRTANIDVTVSATVGSLRGVVFQDLDGNGSQGAGEPGIANVDVILTNGSFTRTVTTDANGVYTADNVPTGSVTVDVNT
ncbi:MAG: tandem-95 repeat protein, partial [Bacteroidetes bacterium]